MSSPFPYAEHPAYRQLLEQLREDFTLGLYYMTGVMLLVFEFDGPPHADRVSLASKAIEGSIRLNRGTHRNIFDSLVLMGDHLFVCLGSISTLDFPVPLARMVRQLVAEFAQAARLEQAPFLDGLSVGVAHWAPEAGAEAAVVLVQEVWSALQEAQDGKAIRDPARFLEIPLPIPVRIRQRGAAFEQVSMPQAKDTVELSRQKWRWPFKKQLRE